MTTVSQALLTSSEILSKSSDTPELDAQTFLAHILGKSRAWIIAHPHNSLPQPSLDTFNQDLSALNQGIPLPYVLGSWEFYGLGFKVTPDVLIPRPETELLVDHGIQWLKENPRRGMAADIGTGSGCIAVALAKNINNLSVIATDISHPALTIAQENARFHSMNRQIHFLQADLLTGISIKFDLICANLPYIPSTNLRQLAVYGREPDAALDGGEDGLDYIAKIIESAPHSLAPGGKLMLEIEQSQAERVTEIARTAVNDWTVEVFKDLAGHDRMVSILMPENN